MAIFGHTESRSTKNWVEVCQKSIGAIRCGLANVVRQCATSCDFTQFLGCVNNLYTIHGIFRPTGLDKMKSPDCSKVGILYCQGGRIRQGGHMLQQENKTNKVRLSLAMPHLDFLFCYFTRIHTTSCMGSKFFYFEHTQPTYTTYLADAQNHMLVLLCTQTIMVSMLCIVIELGKNFLGPC